MIDPARMRRGAWDVYHAALGLPHDACIQVARSPLVFYDQGWQTSYEQGSFQTMNFVPIWYRQNHAKEGVANVRMSILNPSASPHQQNLVWRTIRAVEQGEELRFTYTDVPREWDADQRIGISVRDEGGEIESMIEGLLSVEIASDAPGGRKRKGPALPRPPTAPRAHWGLPSDSSDRLSSIALSRLVRSPDPLTVSQVFENPPGVAVLAALRDVVLRVAVTVGGADLTLTSVNVMSLFNLSGSTFLSQRKYDGGLSLPSKLPFSSAKALVKAMLDALAAALVTPDGSRLMTLLLRIPIAPLDAALQATIAAVMATVEADMTSRLQSGGASSSSSSLPLPMPIQPMPAQPAPVQLDVSVSLSTNAARLVQSRLGRALTQAEHEALDEGLVEAFSLLTTENQTQRAATLQLVAFTTLSTPAGAQLWASLLEVAAAPLNPGGSFSVDTFVSALINVLSAIAGAQLAASAFGV